MDRAFDPIWYSPEEHYWKDTMRTEPDGTEHEGAILLRGTLTLNEIREGDHDNMFSFNLFSFGIAARKGLPWSNIDDNIGPVKVMQSDHTMKIESDDLDVRDITTNYPRIGVATGEKQEGEVDRDVIKEVPDRKDEWTTEKSDLEQAETDLSGSDESLMLGGASIATGVAAGVPTLGVGTAALLTGTSAVFGLSGMINSMDDSGETEIQKEDKWKYHLKETDSFLIFNYDKNISVFSHNLIIDVPVEHGESASIDIYDSIEESGATPVPYQDDEKPWVNNHESMEWTVDIPSYRSGEDPEKNPPSPDGAEKTL
ncbi:hypothetical protein SVXHr_0140 [Halorhabdus sp. SVX81]|nr:hypothetical protein SVXHr_0140 [Halorhabdus sp. SVX81]